MPNKGKKFKNKNWKPNI